MDTLFEWYGEGGGCDGYTELQDAVDELLEIRLQDIEENDDDCDCDYAIQEVRYDDGGMAVAHRQMVLDHRLSWLGDKIAVIAALRAGAWHWGEWESLV